MRLQFLLVFRVSLFRVTNMGTKREPLKRGPVVSRLSAVEDPSLVCLAIQDLRHCLFNSPARLLLGDHCSTQWRLRRDVGPLGVRSSERDLLGYIYSPAIQLIDLGSTSL